MPRRCVNADIKWTFLAIRQEGESSSAVIEGVRVFRIQLRVRDEKSKIGYLRKLVMFFLRSMFFFTWEQIKEPYDLIHVHSVPDFEVFAALVPKLMGCKVILDIHDIVPEFYASKFKTSSNSAVFRLLVAVERMSAGFSDHVIAANHIWEERLVQRSVRRDKCTAMINYSGHRHLPSRARTATTGNSSCCIRAL